jgi:hypothetical protein
MSKTHYVENSDGTLNFNNLKFNASLAHHRKCTQCNRIAVFLEDFDAYCCLVCNVWLESKCSDETCSYCYLRPDFPAMSGVQTNQKHDLIKVRNADKKRERQNRYK